MELRKDAQRTRNSRTQMKADTKTSKALGMEYPHHTRRVRPKEKKDLPSPSPGTLPPPSVPWGS